MTLNKYMSKLTTFKRLLAPMGTLNFINFVRMIKVANLCHLQRQINQLENLERNSSTVLTYCDCWHSYVF